MGHREHLVELIRTEFPNMKHNERITNSYVVPDHYVKELYGFLMLILPEAEAHHSRHKHSPVTCRYGTGAVLWHSGSEYLFDAYEILEADDED